MTADRRLKQKIRERMALTGENYTVARRHVLEARAQAAEPEPASEESAGEGHDD